MKPNQTECFRLKQRSVIIYLVAEEYKPSEIYWRMCDGFGEVVISQTIFINEPIRDLSLRVWIEKTVYRVKTYWLTGKEKVLCAVVSKEGHTDSVL